MATFFLCFCLVNEGREDPNATISGPLSARHLMNGVSLACR